MYVRPSCYEDLGHLQVAPSTGTHQAGEAIPAPSYDGGTQGQEDEAGVDVTLRTRIMQGRIPPLEVGVERIRTNENS